MKRAVVFLNGEYAEDDGFYRALIDDADFVVAADGGAAALRRLGVPPHVVVGDLDSLSSQEVAALQRERVPIQRHPECKNETDAELAVAEALAQGAGELVLAGALGGGLDHTLGTIAVLRRLAARGVPAAAVEPGLTVRVARAPALHCVRAPRGTRFSLAPLTAVAVVSLRGFAYELQSERLRADSCRALGNSIDTECAEVELHAGVAALFVFSGAPLALGANVRAQLGD